MIPAQVHLLPPPKHRARWLALTLLLFGPLAFGVLALLLGQDANWDFRNYHWYNAYAFLNGRNGIDLLPSQIPYFYNPLLDVPFYLLATHVPAIGAGFVLGLVQGINFVVLFMLAYATLVVANIRTKVLICATLAALGMLGGEGISLLGTTFGDNILSLGLLWSGLLVIRHIDRLMSLPLRGACLRTLLFALPAGLAVGLKLPAVYFAFGLCFAFFGTGGSFKRRFWMSFSFGLGIMIGCAITYGYWGWFLQSHFGDPVFPYFAAFFKSPFAPSTELRDTKFIPGNFHDFILFPFLFAESPFRVGEIAWRDWRVPMLYALLPLALLARAFFGRARQQPDAIARPLAARYLLWVAVIAYFAWIAAFAIYRYAVPLEMIAPLLIVCVVGFLPLKLQIRGILAAVLLIVVAASVQGGNWTRRDKWLDHFVEVTIPPLGDTSDLMILMAGIEPYSHLVPAFPPEIPFVRIQSNFFDNNPATGFNPVIRARVEGHKGRFLILIPGWQYNDLGMRKALRGQGLQIASDPCQTVIDRLYLDLPMDLCRVERLGK